MSTMQASLFELPVVRTPPKVGRAFVRQIESQSILTPTKGRLAAYDFSLNPYRGCGFGCSYCYAAFFVPDDVRRDAWGEWVEVKANAVQLLAKHRDLGDARIYMSSVTDPYQPLEDSTRLSRSILEHLADRAEQPRIVIQTRGPLVTRDIDVLSRFRHLRVNMSITTDSDEVRKRFEPSCASIERRLQAVRDLKEAGIKVGVCVSPMLPIEDPIGFARTLRDLHADRYAASFFHSSDRLFSSSTGQKATDIAKEFEWTHSRYARAKEILKQLVPGFDGPGGFDPE
ncbi:MAG: radical SAM protein [Chlorobia bacterium]|nr:radical SAM protein [Fimbriimonadaceae bacterium]